MTETLSLWPPALAVIVAVPVCIAVTRPLLLTVITFVSLLCQVIVTPLIGLPAASIAVAVN
jgi:hypothetical protein